MQSETSLIHGGSPGHAMLVVDMAADEKGPQALFTGGKAICPPRDIHIVKKPFLEEPLGMARSTTE